MKKRCEDQAEAQKRRAVLITGASSGIGEACAQFLAERGFRIFAGTRTTPPADGPLEWVHLDLLKPESIRLASLDIQRRLGGDHLVGLVNNAGICIVSPLEFLPIAQLREQLEVNLVGQLAVTQAFLPMLRASRGRIINIGSAAGRVALPFLGAYAASKFALQALTEALRRELKAQQISVSIVEAGSIATPIWQKLARQGNQLFSAYPSEAEKLYGKAFRSLVDLNEKEAQKRKTRPEDVAWAVHHALVAKRPRTRYEVGSDAKLNTLASKWVPDRVLDWFFRRMIDANAVP